MKILVSCPDFHGIDIMIADALIKLNCDVKISKWPILSGTIFTRSRLFLYAKISPNQSNQSEIEYKILKNTIMDYNKKLLQEVAAIQPDVLLVLKGDILFPETLKKIRDNSDVFLILWCFDSALRFDNVLKGGKYYHLVYSYEPTDIQDLLKYNIHANFLPMAYDPDYYFKLEDKNSCIDISFVGNLNNYPERKRILGNIISKKRDVKLNIYGTSWTWYNPFLLYEYKINRKELGKHIHNYDIPPKKVNNIYNSSRICLNIHHPQSKQGMNPRTFEILGAGGFQLVDYKKKIEEFFTIGQEIVCYENENDLLNKIEYYLENDSERKRIAQRGHDLVKKKHTYKHRAETILNDIEKIRGCLPCRSSSGL